MFHRVLPAEHPQFAEADPTWTLRDTVFAKCLDFLRRHYNLIAVDDLLAALQDRSILPDRSLLITFDDGWADNLYCALPILQAASAPAVVFAVADGIDGAELWDECLRRQWRAGRLTPPQCDQLWNAVTDGPRPHRSWTDRDDLEELIRGLAPIDRADRAALVAVTCCAARSSAPYMLSAEQLRTLASKNIAVGSHGLTHAPIPLSANPSVELRESRRALARVLGRPPRCLSFPHGVYDASAVEEAVLAGYELLFTSAPALTSIEEHMPLPRCIGRINVPSQAVTDAAGAFRPELLATWLFTRPAHSQALLRKSRFRATPTTPLVATSTGPNE
jgi:peptidoglycan/xylan/chitin deacetylase (PgdA/CDA1 family)